MTWQHEVSPKPLTKKRKRKRNGTLEDVNAAPEARGEPECKATTERWTQRLRDVEEGEEREEEERRGQRGRATTSKTARPTHRASSHNHVNRFIRCLKGCH